MTLSEPAPFIRHRTPAYRAACVAFFLAGFASFALIYCVQPLLPALAAEFGLPPAEASLALSLTTLCLAVSIFVLGAVSQGIGRKNVMLVSMGLAAACNLGVALTPDWHALLALRALEGLVLGGVPAIAMTYLAEEMDRASLGKAMGVYIAGTAFGAMMGRVGIGVLTEVLAWRGAVEVLAVLCFASALGFAALLPPSRHFQRQRGLGPRAHAALWAAHLRDAEMRKIYAIGFCLISVFVAMFNYATFRLVAPPYELGQTEVSLIFLAFILGIFSSQVAGALSDRMGRRRLILVAFGLLIAGACLTLSSSLVVIAVGIGLVSTGFFVGHSVASASVGALARTARGHASSLYLLFYYIGASLMGWIGGWFWQRGGWPWVVGLTVAISVAGALLAVRLRRHG